MIWDFVCIGGGAAGFFAAIAHAESTSTAQGSTLLIEKKRQLLTKVKISGGGRCNVTHHCFEPKEMSAHYPRGDKALIGSLHRWGAEDTVQWFEDRGVELKTESDGRMFPTSDDSQTIINCLLNAAKDAGVEIRREFTVTRIEKTDAGTFQLEIEGAESIEARRVLLATGGTRDQSGAALAEQLGHSLAPAVPSLFTFKIEDERLEGVPGLSAPVAEVSIIGTKLTAKGPLLVTHWGLSGPGILRLSAWGARELAELGYQFTLQVNWLAGINQGDITDTLQALRKNSGKQQVYSRCPFTQQVEGEDQAVIPKRLWQKFVAAAEIREDQTWSQLSKEQGVALINELTSAQYQVSGKSTNKDEFVTCGGVLLKDINFQTMESKLCAGLYFAGEIIDVDGITGGFNFQNAWTSGYLAGSAASS